MDKSPPEPVVAHTRKLAPDPKTNRRRLGFSRRYLQLATHRRTPPPAVLPCHPPGIWRERVYQGLVWFVKDPPGSWQGGRLPYQARAATGWWAFGLRIILRFNRRVEVLNKQHAWEAGVAQHITRSHRISIYFLEIHIYTVVINY